MKKYILAVDPGLKTGVCVIDTEGPKVVYSDELDFEKYVEWLDDRLEEFEDTVLVVERFIITSQTHKNGQAPWSLEGIGAAKAALVRAHGNLDRLVMSHTNAKNFSTNPRLKSVGLWHKGGAGHANDALRHALHYIVSVGWSNERLLAK